MFHRILVPLDGSKRAERALPVAARIAQATRGTLIAVQVIDTDLAPFVMPDMILTDTNMQAELDSAIQYLTQATRPFEHQGFSLERVAETGRTVPLLLSTVVSYNADLIIMCSHGRTGFSRWALGSVAERIADGSSVPTLIIHEHGPVPTGRLDPMRPLRILVPLDGSDAALSALDPAASLVAGLAAPDPGALHMMRVVRPPANEQTGVYSFERQMEHAKHSLSRMAENVRYGIAAPSVAHLNMDVTYSVTSDQDVAHAILHIAENGEDADGWGGVFGGDDIIAMATHGRTGFDYLTLGSITKRVLHATKLPVLIVPPTQVKQQKSFHAMIGDPTLNRHYTISGIE